MRDETQSDTLSVRVPVWVRDELLRVAAKGESLSEVTRRFLMDALGKNSEIEALREETLELRGAVQDLALDIRRSTRIVLMNAAGVPQEQADRFVEEHLG